MVKALKRYEKSLENSGFNPESITYYDSLNPTLERTLGLIMQAISDGNRLVNNKGCETVTRRWMDFLSSQEGWERQALSRHGRASHAFFLLNPESEDPICFDPTFTQFFDTSNRKEQIPFLLAPRSSIIKFFIMHKHLLVAEVGRENPKEYAEEKYN